MTLYFHPTIKITKKGKTSLRRVTVAGVPSTTTEGERVLRLGFAVCSSKDQFVKKVGRTKAEGRAKSEEKSTIISVGNITPRQELGVFLQAAIAGITALGFTVLPKRREETTPSVNTES
jgi:hypothetical protein